MIEHEFLDNLPDEPLKIIQSVSEMVLVRYSATPGDAHKIDDYEFYIEAFGLFQAFAEAFGLNFKYPDLTTEKLNNINSIVSYLADRKKDAEKEMSVLLLSNAREKYSVRFRNAFYYEFTDGDLKRIQELVNEIRNLTVSSMNFEEEHRRRILKRLEKLQRELHKKMSSVDQFWSLIGDAGVALGKLGEDAKPFVERIREIVDIIWRVQAMAEQLPSGSSQPLLKEHIKMEERKP